MAKVRAEPGIATIFDCDWYMDAATGTRAPFIVMEYVPGALPITTYANEHRLGMRGAHGVVPARLRSRGRRPSRGHHPPRPEAGERDGERHWGAPS